MLTYEQRRRSYLRALGRYLGGEYIRAVEAIAGTVDATAIAFAEMVCPRLKRYRRRAKAAAKLLRREAA